MIMLAAAIVITAAIEPVGNPPRSDPGLAKGAGIPADADDYVEGLAKLGIAKFPGHSGALQATTR